MIVEKQPDTILHLGAGRCSEFPEWDASGARRIILVEADPEKARYLRAAYGQDKRVEVVERAVSGSGGPGTLRRLNVARFSSLGDVSTLTDLYPGLRVLAEFPVVVASVSDLITDFHISSDNANWLVVETLGEEAAIIDRLRENGYLARFERVVVAAGAHTLQESEFSGEDLIEALNSAGYEVTACETAGDPDVPRWVFQRDDVKIENGRLVSRVTELEEQLTSERLGRTQQESLAGQRTHELEALTHERDEEAKRVSELSDELTTLREQLERQRTELEAKEEAIRDLKRDLAEERDARENQESLAQEREDELQMLRKERDGLHAKGEKQEKDVQNLRISKQQLERIVTERDQRLEEIESEYEEWKARQTSQEGEILKAQGQLDVIKDLLLRERSL